MITGNVGSPRTCVFPLYLALVGERLGGRALFLFQVLFFSFLFFESMQGVHTPFGGFYDILVTVMRLDISPFLDFS